MQVDEAAVSHGNSGHCNSETSANVDRSLQQNSVHCKFDTAKQDEAILVLYIFSGKVERVQFHIGARNCQNVIRGLSKWKWWISRSNHILT